MSMAAAALPGLSTITMPRLLTVWLVSAADGHTYEREVIEDWLAKKNSSPLTASHPRAIFAAYCRPAAAHDLSMFEHIHSGLRPYKQDHMNET